MSTPDDRYAEHQMANYRERVAKFAQGLRNLADRIEQGPVRPNAAVGDGKPDHAWHVQQIIHELMWSLANLNLGGLVGQATDADRALRPAQRQEGDQR